MPGFSSTKTGIQATSPINTALILCNSKNLTKTMAQMDRSMIDAIRSTPGAKNSNVDGDAYKSSTVIHVRWGWIALPIAYVMMAILILVATAISSKITYMESFYVTIPSWSHSNTARA